MDFKKPELPAFTVAASAAFGAGPFTPARPPPASVGGKPARAIGRALPPLRLEKVADRGKEELRARRSLPPSLPRHCVVGDVFVSPSVRQSARVVGGDADGVTGGEGSSLAAALLTAASSSSLSVHPEGKSVRANETRRIHSGSE